MIAFTQKEQWQSTTAVIADNGTTSAAATIGDHVTEVVVHLPTLISGTITPQGSMDGTTYVGIWTLCGDGAAPKAIVTGATTGDHFLVLAAPNVAPAFPYYKIVSGASQTAGPLTLTFYYR